MSAVARAEDFLLLLDDLAAAKPNSATAAVLLAHAATHLRALLELADETEREADADATEEPGLYPDLPHLPPMADAGEPRCEADSPRDSDGLRWTCHARLGHPERLHADYTPAAWPVADRETGLPRWATGAYPGPGVSHPVPGCGAAEGRWACNAVPGHEPLDHAAFAPWESPLAGTVLARWASVRPMSQAEAELWQVSQQTVHALTPGGNLCGVDGGPAASEHADVTCPECVLWLALQPAEPCTPPCGCPVRDRLVYHQRGTCTDPVVARLGWYAETEPPERVKVGEWPPEHPAHNGHALRPPQDVPGQEASGEGPDITAGRQHHGPPHADNTGEAVSPGRAPQPEDAEVTT